MQRALSSFDSGFDVSLAPRARHDAARFALLVRVAREEGLVILRRQVKVVKRERLFFRGGIVALVLGAAKQVHRILPDLALEARLL